MKRNWTEEEDEYILNNHNNMTWDAMSKFLGCTISTTKRRAQNLGIKVEYKEVGRWSEEEIELLREYADKYITKTIARKLNKSIVSVQKKALKEGILLHGSNDPWKKWMIDYLKDNIETKSLRQIALFIGLSEHRVREKCKELNIEYKSNRWSEEEVNILIDNHDKCHYSQLTKLLPNKSSSAILCKARDMKLNIISESNHYKYDRKIAKFIKDNWGKISINEMARQLGIPRSRIYIYKKRLRLPNTGQMIKWDKQTLDELRRLSKSKTITQLAKHFNTSNLAISSIASKNNIKLINGRNKWDDKIIEEIRRLASDHTVNEICTTMNMERSSLHILMRRNKIVAKSEITNRWTDDEINYLLNNKRYNLVIDIPTMMKSIDKTDKSIMKKCDELGVRYILFPKKEWTDEEVVSLIEDAKTHNIKQLVMKYNRSSLSITTRLNKYNVKPVSLNDYWSKEEVDLLVQLVNENKSINEIAKMLNRSVSAVENKVIRKKLDYAQIKHWSKKEEQLLMDLWDEYNIGTISKRMNRSVSSIKNKANSLGLKKQFFHQDAIKIEEISEIFNIDRHTVETTWMILGLPCKIQKISDQVSYKYVEIDDLFAFLEDNQFLYDGKDFEENILGMEPNWVKEKRKHDTFYGFEYNRTSLIKKKLLQQKKYYLELKKEENNNKKVLKKEP